MADSGKPFTLYRRKWWYWKIVPNNAAGWRAFALWLLPMAAIVALIVLAMQSEPEGLMLVAILAAYAAALASWALVMTRWMVARADVIEIDGLLAKKREHRR